MKHKIFLIKILLILFPVFLICAQEGPQALSPYLVPQTVYVGDRARMIMPLGQAFSAVPAFTSTNPENLFVPGNGGASAWNRQLSETNYAPVFPEQGVLFSDLHISRIELEQRSGSPRLMIDFIPFNTGVINFPDIMIPGDSSLVITGLRVNVASILEPHEASLSGIAPPLPAPGTGLLIYGSFALVIIFLFACILGALWFKNHFTGLKMHLKRRRLLKAMERLLKQLWIENPEQEGGSEKREEYFSILSREFREFLSLFTGFDCRALTPGEFIKLELEPDETINRDYLYEIFKRWESIRFSGAKISSEEFFSVLEEIRSLINTLETAEKNAGRSELANAAYEIKEAYQ